MHTHNHTDIFSAQNLSPFTLHKETFPDNVFEQIFNIGCVVYVWAYITPQIDDTRRPSEPGQRSFTMWRKQEAVDSNDETA